MGDTESIKADEKKKKGEGQKKTDNDSPHRKDDA
jgi:hypothetical protein